MSMVETAKAHNLDCFGGKKSHASREAQFTSRTQCSSHGQRLHNLVKEGLPINRTASGTGYPAATRMPLGFVRLAVFWQQLWHIPRMA